MKEELMAQVLPILEKTKEGILKAVEIVQAEMPELIQQVLAWNFTISLIGCIVGWVIFVLGICLFQLIHKEVKDTSDNGCQAISLALLVPGLLMGVLNLTWLKIAIAPKLFLIEYVTNLIK